MSDLQTLSEEFKKWKGDLAYCRYPTHLWDKAYALTAYYPLKTIAEALGTSIPHLKRKFSNREKPVTFASLQITASPVKVEFKHMTIYASHEQLSSIIPTLLRDI
jgi:hypothetical protein